MTRRMLTTRTTHTTTATREVAMVDKDCATCHGTGRSTGGVPCRPCGVTLSPKQRENVARLRLRLSAR